ncbi:acyl-CoA dehydrogenase C-terminal domain-containing protein [Acetobacter lovaniensis]|jgi:alkylation response protein AidB-like acyl-CoA dehydrogenase|uniref:acyl-CoA dehydrogenase C-terminal domain-containing protein n=1 Tax=Acetobacter lovaniensis TaxID=104100 RepID=UPI00209CEA49|nr:acyl-CoA dehydrogenase C-terminal domain-containing protein [Acetobacter lovaniensis]MCP1240927.1 acyl-CoA dehydrogenase C-terminal domain-containing protein [Acetobacter lovaniensis]
MPHYKAPVEDMMFLLRDVFRVQDIFAELPEQKENDLETISSILEEAGKFCSEILYPLNAAGDIEGCRLENGIVRTPKGFAEAWKAFSEAGWGGLSAPTEYGGQNLPRTVQILVDEMLSGSNLSFGLFPGLTRGACEAIEAHASQALKDTYLPNMVSGVWTGAMALTEGNAGSDLGLLKATATPRADGSWTVTGSKIFISSGDHDMAENVIHLVLARIPGAPAGTKGISLFLCPKILVNADGTLGARNAISVGALEHKMGIHAQPTCVMNYDGCQGWMVGEPNRGLAAMFVMMNAERLFVGVQGLGVADASCQTALAYARERMQGRSPDRAGTVPIIAHADVRRTLLSMQSFIEAARAMVVYTALEMDREKFHPDATIRQRAGENVALLTPVIKAALTDFGFEAAVAGQQVLGGHGYIREWGQEQYVRDARIAMIYEGTNGIQAQDLVIRKLTLAEGQPVRSYFAQIRQTLAVAAAHSDAASLAEPLGAALDLLEGVTTRLISGDLSGPDDRNAAAVDYLRLFALVSFGWMWVRMVLACAPGQPLPDALVQHKRAAATFFMQRVLPQATALSQQISAGAGSIMALPDELF